MLIQPSKTLGNTQFIFQRNNNITYKLYKQVSDKYIKVYLSVISLLFDFQPILIQDLTAQKGSTDHVENGTDANRVLKICDKNKQTISVLASTANDCNLWLKQIEGAKDVYNSVTSLVKSRPKSSKLYVLLQADDCFLGYFKCVAQFTERRPFLCLSSEIFDLFQSFN